MLLDCIIRFRSYIGTSGTPGTSATPSASNLPVTSSTTIVAINIFTSYIRGG